MSISTPFIHRPIATSLVMAALVLVGIAAYPLLPVAPLPRVDFPTIVVSGSLPGASPETMAATVAQPLETQIAQIPGVAQLTSVSVLGSTSVTVQFDLDRNIDGAAGDIQAAIQAASGQLPKIMPGPPTYRKVNPSDAPIMILAAQSDALPLIETDDYSENVLSQQISQISGVAQVLIGGQQKRAVRVEVEPDKLAAMGLTLEDVRNLLVSATVNAPKGSIDGEHKAYTVYDNDQLTRASQYENVVLAYRNGAAVRVRDIGRAIDGPENRLLAGWQNGKRGILLIIFKQPGANVIETVQRIKTGVAAAGSVDTAFDPRQHHHGPHSDHPRLGRRRAVHPDAGRLPGRDGDLPVPAQRLGHHHPQHYRSRRADLHVRRDVPAGLQSGQPVADGADAGRRLRHRRCDRDAGEHLPPRRGRHEADGGGHQRRRRNRLHHRLDQLLAGRGVHPAAVHGRHRRAAVPRIRHDRSPPQSWSRPLSA